MLFFPVIAAACLGLGSQAVMARTISAMTSESTGIITSEFIHITSYYSSNYTVTLYLTPVDNGNITEPTTRCTTYFDVASPTRQPPSASDLALRADPAFAWWFPEYYGVGNFSVGVRHDAYGNGTTGLINQDTYENMTITCHQQGGGVVDLECGGGGVGEGRKLCEATIDGYGLESYH